MSAALSSSMKWALGVLRSCKNYGPGDSRSVRRTMRALVRRGLAVEGPERIFTAVPAEGSPQ